MSRSPIRLPTPRGLSDPRRRRAALALAALPLAACTTAAPPFATVIAPPGERPPAPRVRVGDRWRYLETNAYSGEPIAEVTHEAIESDARIRMRLTDARGRPRHDELYLPGWAVLTEATFDFPQTYEQPMPLLPEPLAVGARSRLRTAYRVPHASSRFDWQQWVDAVAWERVRVPAGEFDTLRIERRIWFTHVDHMRYGSTRRDVLWYAPAADRWVRREWSGLYRWPGLRRGAPMREDWVVQELVERAPR